MRTYISAGIGDMCCLDSLLTPDERASISEIYWGCRFGKQAAELLTPVGYPNLIKHHFIEEEKGREMMRQIDPSAENFWHFRPDFSRNFEAGLSLFGIDRNGIDVAIDAAAMFNNPGRTYQGSSILMRDCKEVTQPCILLHLPTSSRPRSDIATFTSDDWQFVYNLADKHDLHIEVISDHLPSDSVIPFEGRGVNFNIGSDFDTIISLIKSAEVYVGCDSFVSILCAKRLSSDNMHVKSHDSNIHSKLQHSTWLQHFYMPHNVSAIQKFYRHVL